MFRQLNDEEGITIILVTHDAEVAGHAKRVIRIRDGLIEEGAFQAHDDEGPREVPEEALQAVAP